MAAGIGRYVRDIPATSSGKVSTYFMYRATTKCPWACWHIKTVKTMYIEKNGHIQLWLTTMQCQQLLTHGWCTFSKWGREHVAFSFPYKGSQYFVYDWLQPVAPQITEDTRPTIVDAPLTLILTMGQGWNSTLFFLYSKPEYQFWLSATYRRSDHPARKTKDSWHCVDAHFNV